MTSRPNQPRWTLTLAALVLATTAGIHVAFQQLSGWAEGQGANLWRREEWLQLLSPRSYVDRGRGRLWMFGPSESREAFMAERLDARLAGLKAFQNSQSLGTLEDGLVALRYIEAEYGRSALPEAILLGVTARFVANIRASPSPMFTAIDKYSAHWRVDGSTFPARLERKGGLDGAWSRVRFLGRQDRAYLNALRALASRALDAIHPGWGEAPQLRRVFTSANYHHLAPIPMDATKAWLVEPGSFWVEVHAWRPSEHHESIATMGRELIELVQEYGISLYVVNMPELSWNRALYDPSSYDEYLAELRTAFGNTPFLDLRSFLTDDQFFDSCHPTLEGSILVSDRVAEFIAAERERGR